MAINMEEGSPVILIGFLIALGVLFVVCIITSLNQERRWRREREACEQRRRRRWEAEAREAKEKTQRMKEQFRKCDWIYKAADFVCSADTAADRIEIWKNQLIIQTGKDFGLYPIERFEAEPVLTTDEMYYANMVLYEVLRAKGCWRYCLQDWGVYCEITRTC